jgi:glycosyltransferase involved in cell wall biosynthesis
MVRFFAGSRKRRPDIVHVHTSSYYSFMRNIPYILWAQRFSRAAVIVHIHGGMFMEFYGRASSPTKHLIHKALGGADAVLVTSPSWIEPIGRVAGPGTEVVPLANGFDSATFRPGDRRSSRIELGIPPEGRVLITVGYLEPIKGHSYLIDAMAEVTEHAGDVRLYILGNGSLRQKLLDQIEERGLTDVVQIVPEPMPSSGIARWMTAADVFVLPSLGEGNPTVMFECLGCGRPFVGTKVGGIPDVIDPGKLGILCPAGDSSSLAAAITEALERKWDAAEITAYAQRYSWTNLVSRLSAIYDKLADKGQ